MNTLFNVNISKFTTIQELPYAWTERKYVELLDAMDYEDSGASIKPEELKEMSMMSLTDYELDEAAKIVLDTVFGDRLSEGQKDNLSHEMIEEKIWEEYPDLSMHEEFFNAGQLLYQAFNGKFPHPEAVKFQVDITGKNTNELPIFEGKSEAVILRLLANGMPRNTLINRLYKEQLEGETFDEAKNILWQVTEVCAERKAIAFEVISSLYWFRDLKFIDSFEGTTHIDQVYVTE